MAESLESRIIKKLNKILTQRNVKIQVLEDHSIGFKPHDFKYPPPSVWNSLKFMLFKNEKEYTIFELANQVIAAHNEYALNDYELAFVKLGLMSLETCASLEEVLLKLEVMYPDS